MSAKAQILRAFSQVIMHTNSLINEFLALNYRGKGVCGRRRFPDETRGSECILSYQRVLRGSLGESLHRQPTEELVPRAFQIAEIQHGERLTFDAHRPLRHLKSICSLNE